MHPALLQLRVIPSVEFAVHRRRLDPVGRIQDRARLGVWGWWCSPGWTGADGRAGIGDRWRQRRNIHQPRHRAVERRCRVAARLMMIGRRRITIATTIVVVVVAVSAVATVIATGIIPARTITINSPAVVIIIIVVAGEALEEGRRRCRRRRPMVDDMLNTRGIRKGILRGVRGRTLEEMQGRRWW